MDVNKPMTTKGQLCAFYVINGNSTLHPFFAEVNSQAEIEAHRAEVVSQIDLQHGAKVEFVLRSLPNSGLHY